MHPFILFLFLSLSSGLLSAENNPFISMEEYSEMVGNLDSSRNKIRTLNHHGSAYCFKTELTESFLDDCSKNSESKHVLEIGCAFGIKSSQIVQTGVFLVANDLDATHLAIMKDTFHLLSKENSCFSRVHYVLGSILDLEASSFGGDLFDAILIESVLHFMNPDEVQLALKKMHSLLKEGGAVYITVSSPFLKHLVVAYEQEKNKKSLWPGFFTDPESIHPACQRLHKPYHAFDAETLSRELFLAGFEIVEMEYIPIPHQEIDLALDGREGLIVIARKKSSAP